MREHGAKFMRYCGVSVVNVITGVGTLFICLEIIEMNRVAANVTAWVVSTIPAYLLSRYWVWQQSGSNSVKSEIATSATPSPSKSSATRAVGMGPIGAPSERRPSNVPSPFPKPTLSHELPNPEARPRPTATRSRCSCRSDARPRSLHRQQPRASRRR